MLHRSDFLSNPTEENYHKYYSEIVYEASIRISTFTFAYAVNSYKRKDFNLNTILPSKWEEMLNDIYINKFVEHAFKRRGDRLTKSTAGCLLKEAIFIRMKNVHPELLQNYKVEEENG